MDERYPTRERKWRSRNRVIKAAGTAAIEARSNVPPNRLPNPAEVDKYEMSAAKAHRRFVDGIHMINVHEADEQTRRELALAGGVEHGFLVMGRTIAYAARAYRNFCDEAWRQPDVAELASLLSSDETFHELVSNLATIPNYMNATIEETYGLTDPSFARSEDDKGYTPFVIGQRESGELYIYPDETLEDTALSQMPRRTFDRYDTCPAHNVFLRPLWEDMVTEAAVDPNLFEADLGLVKVSE